VGEAKASELVGDSVQISSCAGLDDVINDEL